MTTLGLSVIDGPDAAGGRDDAEEADQRRPLAELFRDLRTSSAGLAGREAVRRLAVYGPNQLTRRSGRRWPRELLDQFTQPLAILLAVAAVLAWVGGWDTGTVCCCRRRDRAERRVRLRAGEAG